MFTTLLENNDITNHFFLCAYRPPERDTPRSYSNFIIKFKNGDHHTVEGWSRWSAYEIGALSINFDICVTSLGHDQLVADKEKPLYKLASYIDNFLNIKFMPDILSKKKTTKKSIGMSKEERRNEIADVYSAKNIKFENPIKNILIIDDVTTSGAQLFDIVRALKVNWPRACYYSFTLGKTLRDQKDIDKYPDPDLIFFGPETVKLSASGASPKSFIVSINERVTFEMLKIPAGKFTMGTPVAENGRHTDEALRNVQISEFYLGKYQITQEVWDAVMGVNYCNSKSPTLPVSNVSWDECQIFIKLLNDKSIFQFNGKKRPYFRLPTEAEWEYACRAGTTTAYSFGDVVTTYDANYQESGIQSTITVGRYKPNGFGLFDMHGNVREWCNDYYAENYNLNEEKNPQGPQFSKSDPLYYKRVTRGGSFECSSNDIRSGFRWWEDSYNYYDAIGFRLAYSNLTVK